MNRAFATRFARSLQGSFIATSSSSAMITTSRRYASSSASGGNDANGQPSSSSTRPTRPPGIKITVEATPTVPDEPINSSSSYNQSESTGATSSSAAGANTSSSAAGANTTTTASDPYTYTHNKHAQKVTPQNVEEVLVDVFGEQYQQLLKEYMATGQRDPKLAAMIKRAEREAFINNAWEGLQQWWLLGLLVGISYVYFKTTRADNSTVGSSSSYQYGPLTYPPKGQSYYTTSSNGKDEATDKEDDDAVDERRSAERFTAAQEAMLRWTGVWSASCGVAAIAIGYPLVGMLLFFDYSLMMWGRYGGWESNGAQQQSTAASVLHTTTNADGTTTVRAATTVATNPSQTPYHNLHEEILSKAFPLYMAMALATTFTMRVAKNLCNIGHVKPHPTTPNGGI